MSQFDVSEVVVQAQRDYLGDDFDGVPTIPQLRDALSRARSVLKTTIVKFGQMELNPKMWPQDWTTENAAQTKSEINRVLELYDYYDQAIGAHVYVDDDLWHDVVGPFLAGVCFGPPSCSETVATEAGPDGFAMTPTIARPFIIWNSLEVQSGAAMEAWGKFGDDLAANVSTAARWGLWAAIAGVGVVIVGGIAYALGRAR